MALETVTKEAKVVVPVNGVTEGGTPEPEAVVAPEVVVEAHVDAHPGASTEVVVCEPEIQDVASIRSAPVVEATSTRHGSLELLADDLVDPAVMARNLESMRRVEQCMKVCCRTLSSCIS
jgi:hypothetical protein